MAPAPLECELLRFARAERPGSRRSPVAPVRFVTALASSADPSLVPFVAGLLLTAPAATPIITRVAPTSKAISKHSIR
jgi:hypothetical protein